MRRGRVILNDYQRIPLGYAGLGCRAAVSPGNLYGTWQGKDFALAAARDLVGEGTCAAGVEGICYL